MKKLATLVFLILYSSCSSRGSESITQTAITSSTGLTPAITLNQECDISFEKLQEIQADIGNYVEPQISLDGNTLFIPTASTIKAFSTESLLEIGNYPTKYTNIIGITPDGKSVATTNGDNEIVLWNILTGELKIVLKMPEFRDKYPHIAFSPRENRLAAIWGSCEHGTNTAIWDTNTGELIWHRQDDDCPGGSIAFSPDGKYIVSGETYSRTIRIWDANSGDVREILSESQPERASSITISRSGRWLAYGAGPLGEGMMYAPIVILDTSSDSIIYEFDAKRDTIHSLSISPDEETIVAGTGDGQFLFWNLETGNYFCAKILGKHSVDAYFIQNNVILTVQHDGTITCWKLAR